MSPQDGLWPGSEPKINILAQTVSHWNDMDVVGENDLRVRKRGRAEEGEGKRKNWLLRRGCPGPMSSTGFCWKRASQRQCSVSWAASPWEWHSGSGMCRDKIWKSWFSWLTD